MKTSILCAIFLCVLSLFILECQSNFKAISPTINPFQNVSLVSVYDGDTVMVNLSDLSLPDVFGKRISIRIRHIDAAEMTGHLPCEHDMAVKAKTVVESLLKNAKKIDLENVGRDKYFRLDADLISDGISIGKVLLDKKLAVPYEGETKSKTDWCKMLQK